MWNRSTIDNCEIYMNGIIYVVQFALCHNVPAWQNLMAMNKTSFVYGGWTGLTGPWWTEDSSLEWQPVSPNKRTVLPIKKEPSAFSTTVFLFAICHDLEVYPPVFSSLWLPLVFVCFPAVLPSLVSFSLITPSVFRILSANGTTNIINFSISPSSLILAFLSKSSLWDQFWGWCPTLLLLLITASHLFCVIENLSLFLE